MSIEGHQFDATVLITTKNRRDELRTAVMSVLEQRGCVIEALVIDDGSTDGTAEMIRDEFPSVRLVRSEQSLGLIVQRTRAASMASAPILVSIDDDAVFSSPDIVFQTIGRFDDPRVGAVAIPFVNVRYDPAVKQIAPAGAQIYVVESYIGTAHALRRELFVGLGGYRQWLFHQCEEEDYCIRMLEAGYFVAVSIGDPIHHFESPRRDLERIFVFNARNHLLFAWQNIPHPYCFPHLLVTMMNLLRHGMRRRHLLWTTRGMLDGIADIFRRKDDPQCERRPVSRRTYRLSRRLKKEGPLPIAAATQRA